MDGLEIFGSSFMNFGSIPNKLDDLHGNGKCRAR